MEKFQGGSLGGVNYFVGGAQKGWGKNSVLTRAGPSSKGRRRKGQHGPKCIRCSWKRVTSQNSPAHTRHKQAGTTVVPGLASSQCWCPGYKPHLLYSFRPRGWRGGGIKVHRSCDAYSGREPSANKAAREGQDGIPERKSGAIRMDAVITLHCNSEDSVKPPAWVRHTPRHCSSLLQKGREGVGETFSAGKFVNQ